MRMYNYRFISPQTGSAFRGEKEGGSDQANPVLQKTRLSARENVVCRVFFPTLHLGSKDLKRSQWQAFLPCTFLPPPSIFLITGLNCMRDLDLLAQV